MGPHRPKYFISEILQRSGFTINFRGTVVSRLINVPVKEFWDRQRAIESIIYYFNRRK